MKRQYKFSEAVSKGIYRKIAIDKSLPEGVNLLDQDFVEYDTNISLRFLEDLENNTIATLRYDSTQYASLFVEDSRSTDSYLLNTALKLKLFGLENSVQKVA